MFEIDLLEKTTENYFGCFLFVTPYWIPALANWSLRNVSFSVYWFTNPVNAKNIKAYVVNIIVDAWNIKAYSININAIAINIIAFVENYTLFVIYVALYIIIKKAYKKNRFAGQTYLIVYCKKEYVILLFVFIWV